MNIVPGRGDTVQDNYSKSQDPSSPHYEKSDSSKSNASSPLIVRKPSLSGDGDHREDLSEYFSEASLTHRSRDDAADATNDETYVSVRSRASLEDALWSDDEGRTDTASSSADPAAARESMRLLAAAQECRLLLARGADLQRRGSPAEACRALALALDAARALGDAGLQAQALARLGLLYRRAHADVDGAAARIQRVYRGHLGRSEARSGARARGGERREARIQRGYAFRRTAPRRACREGVLSTPARRHFRWLRTPASCARPRPPAGCARPRVHRGHIWAAARPCQARGRGRV
jgi:hypothetical protein